MATLTSHPAYREDLSTDARSIFVPADTGSVLDTLICANPTHGSVSFINSYDNLDEILDPYGEGVINMYLGTESRAVADALRAVSLLYEAHHDTWWPAFSCVPHTTGDDTDVVITADPEYSRNLIVHYIESGYEGGAAQVELHYDTLAAVVECLEHVNCFVQPHPNA